MRTCSPRRTGADRPHSAVEILAREVDRWVDAKQLGVEGLGTCDVGDGESHVMQAGECAGRNRGVSLVGHSRSRPFMSGVLSDLLGPAHRIRMVMRLGSQARKIPC